jgi:hypothetical protein
MFSSPTSVEILKEKELLKMTQVSSIIYSLIYPRLADQRTKINKSKPKFTSNQTSL